MNRICIATWNSTLSAKSFGVKRGAYEAWLQWFTKTYAVNNTALLVVLIEASPTVVTDEVAAGLDYKVIGYVNTQAANSGLGDMQIAKSIVAMLRPGNSGLATDHNFTNGTTLRFPGLDGAKRATLKVNVTSSDRKTIALWFVHANASSTGGKAMAQAADAEISKNDQTAVFGDLNLAFEKLDAKADWKKVRPIGYDQKALAFTNWNLQGNQLPSPINLADMGVVGAVYKSIKPGSVLDYCLAGNGTTVTALPNCENDSMQKAILCQFDHYPAVFALEW